MELSSQKLGDIVGKSNEGAEGKKGEHTVELVIMKVNLVLMKGAVVLMNRFVR